MTTTKSEAPLPVLYVEAGDPSPEELAALTVLLSSMAGGDQIAESGASPWATQTRKRRSAPRPGPDAWRLSTRT